MKRKYIIIIPTALIISWIVALMLIGCKAASLATTADETTIASKITVATETTIPETAPMLTSETTAATTATTSTETTAASTAKLTIDSLKNLEYKVEYTQSGVAKLANGEYQEEAAPGSATKIVVQLTGYIAFGNLNNDKVEDAAVILVSQPGGSGTFYDLAAVLNKDGNLKSTNSIFLGDRIKIKTISIDSGIIAVNYLGRKEDQAMADEPTVDKTQTFIVENDILSPAITATTAATTTATTAATTATTS